MPDDMRTLKCKECESLFEVPASGGAYSCPGCGKSYMIRPRGESTAKAAPVRKPRRKPASGSDGDDTGKFSTTRGRRRVRGRKSQPFDLRTGSVSYTHLRAHET